MDRGEIAANDGQSWFRVCRTVRLCVRNLCTHPSVQLGLSILLEAVARCIARQREEHVSLSLASLKCIPEPHHKFDNFERSEKQGGIKKQRNSDSASILTVPSSSPEINCTLQEESGLLPHDGESRVCHKFNYRASLNEAVDS